MIDTFRTTKTPVYQKVVRKSCIETSASHSVYYSKRRFKNHVFLDSPLCSLIFKVYTVKNVKMNKTHKSIPMNPVSHKSYNKKVELSKCLMLLNKTSKQLQKILISLVNHEKNLQKCNQRSVNNIYILNLKWSFPQFETQYQF